MLFVGSTRRGRGLSTGGAALVGGGGCPLSPHGENWHDYCYILCVKITIITPPAEEISFWSKYKRFRNSPYYVSPTGEIFRLYRNTKTKPTRLKRLSPSPGTYGYPRIHLSWDGKKKECSVHSVVAEVFYGKAAQGYCVNHKDGVKTNNHPSNLEWVTPKGNVDHAWATGLSKPHPKKLTREQVEEIRTSCLSYRELSTRFGISYRTVVKVQHGEIWRHVPGARKLQPRAKLTIEQVREIKRSPHGYKKLSKLYGVGRDAIKDIKKGITWKTV